ncbi:sirohydrochlorin chelatase [Demequina zhanjiangensis]|uniref:Sirohydrochlorin chelatase n=1 Tax=Demequina zhanjiangensis TaxID=3051659 RepID=A0ABT8G031_9MICO|nr:sirohydrochlorin chelatase [Demequina sp. SYSU T00b26]MDN4472457.1 sirohydrochlorin chelatase [Demequina sp. SYSU T00b26]
MTSPILIGCAHGTRSEAGREVVRELLQEVRAALPDVDVREAYVDVHGPDLNDVVAEIEQGEGLQAVVVPLLLAGGYHVYHDIANAVADRPDVVATSALGPDSRLVKLLMARLAEAGVPEDATVVLAPAGSSDERSQADTEKTAEMLRTAWHGPVRVGFAADFTPTVSEAVATARDFGEDGAVAVASYLLAPGVFQDRLAESGADCVTKPLAPHRVLVDIVVGRYREACGV